MGPGNATCLKPNEHIKTKEKCRDSFLAPTIVNVKHKKKGKKQIEKLNAGIWKKSNTK